jgi:uncharacterized protein
LIKEANSGSHGLHWWFFNSSELRAGWRLLAFVAIVWSSLKAASWLIAKALSGADKDAIWLLTEALVFLVCLAAAWIMAKIEGRTVSDYGLPWRRMFRGQFWLGVATGFAAITVLLGVLRGAGVFHFGRVALHGAAAWRWAAVYGFVFLLVAFKEEFLLRSYAQFTLSSGIGYWPAAIVLSAFFGYGHLGNSGESRIGALAAGGFGLLLCLLLRRTGNLWMPIGLHAAWDWGESYFYGVPDSGTVLPGHLFNSSTSGPAWLTGGTVGPEGSWLCLLLLVALAVIINACFREVKFADPAALARRRTTGATSNLSPITNEGSIVP